MKIVVCEYPKSGGSWLSSMLATALELPARDLYFKRPEDLKGTALSLHPWYRDAETCDLPSSCIIKSHEKANTELHPEDAVIIHLIRDCRDVCVSKYFYERNFRVSNEAGHDFKMLFRDYIKKTAKDWAAFVDGWLAKEVVTCHYEKFLNAPQTELQRLLTAIGAPRNVKRIDFAVRANNRDNMRRAFRQAYAGEDFVRKGISGDWLNYFSEESAKDVTHVAGSVMQRTGYKDTDVQPATAANLPNTSKTFLEVWELSGFKDTGFYQSIGRMSKASEDLQQFLNGKGWHVEDFDDPVLNHSQDGDAQCGTPDQTPSIVFLGPVGMEADDPIVHSSRAWAKHGLILSEVLVTPRLVRKVRQAGFIIFTAYGDSLVFARPGRSTPKPALANRIRGWAFALKAMGRNMAVRRKRVSSRRPLKSD